MGRPRPRVGCPAPPDSHRDDDPHGECASAACQCAHAVCDYTLGQTHQLRALQLGPTVRHAAPYGVYTSVYTSV